jgi:hypothetical protein
VRVIVVPQLVHIKTLVSVPWSFGRTQGSTRVNRIDALQSGHVGVVMSPDDLMGFPLHLGFAVAEKAPVFFTAGASGRGGGVRDGASRGPDKRAARFVVPSYHRSASYAQIRARTLDLGAVSESGASRFERPWPRTEPQPGVHRARPQIAASTRLFPWRVSSASPPLCRVRRRRNSHLGSASMSVRCPRGVEDWRFQVTIACLAGRTHGVAKRLRRPTLLHPLIQKKRD